MELFEPRVLKYIEILNYIEIIFPQARKIDFRVNFGPIYLCDDNPKSHHWITEWVQGVPLSSSPV